MKGAIGFRSRRYVACGTLVFGVSAVSFSLFGWFVGMNARFSPVYTEIDCKFVTPKLEDVQVSLSSGLIGVLRLEVRCSNPNPYSMMIDDLREGGLFIGPAMTKIGSLTIPTVTLPAKGVGTMLVRKEIALSLPLLSALGSSTSIRFELILNVMVDIDTIFWKLKKSVEVDRDCGLNVKVNSFFQSSEALTPGPMACAHNFSELEIPSWDDPSGSSPNLVDDVQMEDAEKEKNQKLLIAMSITFSLGLLFLVFSTVCCCGRVVARDNYGQGTVGGVDVIGAKDVEVPVA